ncbi:Rrf2 family transcriptional regulator [Leisingera daeponensis]|uniref:Rrf2 family transcriptional regulator n=1 Tax=Leisingera daeponensis TaxID=405746 RepID=UPI000400E6D5|nr:Rrf2 family transcriptional regulator [Leisingera daeponensis]
MKLNLTTDYALRILIFLASKPEELHSIETLSRIYRLPHSSLMKIVSELVRQGYVMSVRGRYGGIKLGQAASAINVGQVVRSMEESFEVANCGECVIQPQCGLRGVFAEAVDAFLNILDRSTVADLIRDKSGLVPLLTLSEAADDP